VPSSTSKPFYFQPPLNVLFELHKLRKIRPWDVNISFLLTSLLKEMEKRGEVDFRASGMALDSSSTIYLMKSKLLLKLEEPPAPLKPPPGFLPPPLFLPLRYELTSTTIQHLLKALDEVLTGERLLALKPRMEPILPSPPEFIPPVDLYLMEIEKLMEKLYSSILQFAGEGRLITFSRFMAGMKKLEAVKTFITLLFLAQTGKVSLWQEEDFCDIYITLREGPPIDG
jgi:chromatin segregation and condensation protein Rec8/ScpA/Scc1 (kleisin family)